MKNSTKHSTLRDHFSKAANWSIVCLVISLFAFLVVNAVAQYAINLIGLKGTELGAVVNGALTFGMMLAAYKAVMAPLGTKPVDDLAMSQMPKHLAAGLAFGSSVFALIVGIAATIGVYQISGTGSFDHFFRALIGTGLLVGFLEELLFRGILFRWIEQMTGSWPALAVTSILFGFAHAGNPGASWISSSAIAIEAGLMLGGAYMLSRNLWFVIGIHAGWNFTQGFIFGVPVSGSSPNGILVAELSGPTLLSGGDFGLEASVITLAVGLCVSIAFLWLAARRNQFHSWPTRRD